MPLGAREARALPARSAGFQPAAHSPPAGGSRPAGRRPPLVGRVTRPGGAPTGPEGAGTGKIRGPGDRRPEGNPNSEGRKKAGVSVAQASQPAVSPTSSRPSVSLCAAAALARPPGRLEAGDWLARAHALGLAGLRPAGRIPFAAPQRLKSADWKSALRKNRRVASGAAGEAERPAACHAAIRQAASLRYAGSAPFFRISDFLRAFNASGGTRAGCCGRTGCVVSPP